MSTPDTILPIYEEKAAAYARRRAHGQSLLERAWLDRLLDRPYGGLAGRSGHDTAPKSASKPEHDTAPNLANSPEHGPQIRALDLGCGPGVPLAAYLLAQGCEVTGVDGARGMIDLFRENLPQANAHHADMRGLNLGATFDAILAWDSFFHLAPADQEAMFPVFARHAAPGARLLFTSGPAEGTAIGAVEGAPVYHSSQSPETYRAWLATAGFAVLSFVPEDPECGMHSVWLAERRS